MPHSNTFCYEFEQHRLDVAQRVLTRQGQSIPLTPKATDVLLLLLQNAGQLVEKDELINQVWPDAFVEEANLTQNIFQLRRALKDDGSGPKYIETVARRGYRFVAPVKRVAVPVVQPEDPLTSVRKSAIPILAVLPFANATGNIDLQYLAEGIPESIINSLSSLSQLRVISRSSAFRYKNRQVDPQTTGKKLGADVLLVGTISGRQPALSVSVELVSVDNAWQLWGQTFKVDSENIFDVQDQIAREISRELRLPLTHEDETRVAKRYTETPLAYQAYLEGRYYWSQYTKVGIEKAIVHFERAIELDPNYALAYAGIVDCYLRLATNYLPPEDALLLPDDVDFESDATKPLPSLRTDGAVGPVQIADEKVKLRHEWDWKGAERELRRANELRTDYPAAHQWHAALVFSRDLFYECCDQPQTISPPSPAAIFIPRSRMARQISSLQLTPSERVQVFCAVAREQIDSGNYEGACQVLGPWWSWGKWPSFESLKPESCADLLFTAGRLAGCVASARQIAQGQKHGEALLNGAIALFESVGAHRRAAEARIELGLCYYRQGLFDLGRTTFESTFSKLLEDDPELLSLGLIRLASLERHAGRPYESLKRLREAEQVLGLAGPWVTGRRHLEYASTFKDLAEIEDCLVNYDYAREFYEAALHEFEAVGNHRLAAICLNNLGYMLIKLSEFEKAEIQLRLAERMFVSFGDRVLRAQVNDSLARLFLASNQSELAVHLAEAAVNVLEDGDEDVLLAEAATTLGTGLCMSNRMREGKSTLERAYRIAERCGDLKGAGRPLLVMADRLLDYCDVEECRELRFRLRNLSTRAHELPIAKQLDYASQQVLTKIQDTPDL